MTFLKIGGNIIWHMHVHCENILGCILLLYGNGMALNIGFLSKSALLSNVQVKIKQRGQHLATLRFT